MSGDPFRPDPNTVLDHKFEPLAPWVTRKAVRHLAGNIAADVTEFLQLADMLGLDPADGK